MKGHIIPYGFQLLLFVRQMKYQFCLLPASRRVVTNTRLATSRSRAPEDLLKLTNVMCEGARASMAAHTTKRTYASRQAWCVAARDS